MVGTSEEALAFIQEFTERRFQPKVEKVLPPKPASPPPQQQQPVETIPRTESEGLFPSLPSNQQPYETLWPANFNVHHKKEDEYFAG